MCTVNRECGIVVLARSLAKKQRREMAPNIKVLYTFDYKVFNHATSTD